MITHQHPHYYQAKICFECQSPLSIKHDDSDPTLDTTLMLDVNSNPIIPGTSIAGVLRHLYKEEYGNDALFGNSGIEYSDNSPSLVKVGFGFVHNQENQAQIGINNKSDDILDYLQNALIRDQNKLNACGVVETTAKLDRSAVPNGTRFSFELGLSSKLDDEEFCKQWQQLITLLSHPKFRLGGLTHRGFGKLSLVKIQEQYFDFKVDFNKWKKNETSNSEQKELKKFEVNCNEWRKSEALNCEQKELKQNAELIIKAEDFWRIGSGNQALSESCDKDPNDTPYTESVICWKNDKASLKHGVVVVPATSIKGALRHRTLFHLRLLNKDFLGEKIQEECANLCQLFGNKASKNTHQGVGGLLIDDVYLPNHSIPKIMMHNKIDRFTGGVMNGALFSEELLYQDTLKISMYFDPRKLKRLDSCVKNAFINAVEDLCKGRLSLGAGSAKGHGYFTGDGTSVIDKFKEACQCVNY